MENLKHTTGEWVTPADITPKGQSMVYVKGTNKLLAYVQNEDVDTDEERTANAKLIAAAPDLLEALTELLKTAENMGILLESKYWTEKFRDEWNKSSNLAEIAINKATL